jgi:hypothetical protein
LDSHKQLQFQGLFRRVRQTHVRLWTCSDHAEVVRISLLLVHQESCLFEENVRVSAANVRVVAANVRVVAATVHGVVATVRGAGVVVRGAGAIVRVVTTVLGGAAIVHAHEVATVHQDHPDCLSVEIARVVETVLLPATGLDHCHGVEIGHHASHPDEAGTGLVCRPVATVDRLGALVWVHHGSRYHGQCHHPGRLGQHYLAGVGCCTFGRNPAWQSCGCCSRLQGTSNHLAASEDLRFLPAHQHHPHQLVDGPCTSGMRPGWQSCVPRSS